MSPSGIPNNRIERDSGKAVNGLTGAVHPRRWAARHNTDLMIRLTMRWS